MGHKEDPKFGVLLEVLLLGSVMAPSFSLGIERPGPPGQPFSSEGGTRTAENRIYWDEQVSKCVSLYALNTEAKVRY